MKAVLDVVTLLLQIMLQLIGVVAAAAAICIVTAFAYVVFMSITKTIRQEREEKKRK